MFQLELDSKKYDNIEIIFPQGQQNRLRLETHDKETIKALKSWAQAYSRGWGFGKDDQFKKDIILNEAQRVISIKGAKIIKYDTSGFPSFILEYESLNDSSPINLKRYLQS